MQRSCSTFAQPERTRRCRRTPLSTELEVCGRSCFRTRLLADTLAGTLVGWDGSMTIDNKTPPLARVKVNGTVYTFPMHLHFGNVDTPRKKQTMDRAIAIKPPFAVAFALTIAKCQVPPALRLFAADGLDGALRDSRWGKWSTALMGSAQAICTSLWVLPPQRCRLCSFRVAGQPREKHSEPLSGSKHRNSTSGIAQAGRWTGCSDRSLQDTQRVQVGTAQL